MKIATIDIGGTFIKSAIYENGTLGPTTETPTNAQLGGPQILDTIIHLLSKEKNLDCIGISATGQVNTEGGFIKYGNANVADYIGLQIGKILKSRFSIPVFVENDVNAAAMGEAYYGAAAHQKEKNFLCLAYGTGIGGALFLNDKLFYGSDFSAVEVGHIITHAEKLPRAKNVMEGAYETFASTAALVRQAKATDETLTSGRLIFANLHRPEVKAVVDDWIHEILCGLASLIYTINPNFIVLGGGVMSAPYILPHLIARLPDYCMGGHLPVTLCCATLGNNAALMGMVHICQRKHQLKIPV